MPIFIVEGKGKDTGRKRKRRYRAKSGQAAIEMALNDGTNDGTIADEVIQVEVTHWLTHVAGVTHKNADNSSRQRILRECRGGEFVLLEHEQGNRHDVHATRVLRHNGNQIGYLPADIAQPLIDDWHKEGGCRYIAFVLSIASFESDPALLSMDLCVYVAASGANPETVADYVRTNEEGSGSSIPWERLIPDRQLTSKPRPNYARSGNPNRQQASDEMWEVSEAAARAGLNFVEVAFDFLSKAIRKLGKTSWRFMSSVGPVLKRGFGRWKSMIDSENDIVAAMLLGVLSVVPIVAVLLLVLWLR